jgi:catechol 2,3-dioxygenase-like lactoylglutathione lyase family enzyme
MLLSCLLTFLAIGVPQPSAPLPPFYKNVNRVTWVVKDIHHTVDGWTKLGLSDVHDYGMVKLTGAYRGKPQLMAAQEVTGHLGNLTVDVFQPVGGHNAFTDFLARRGDGIFAMVYEVTSKEEMEAEVQRMNGLGVKVLQQIHTGDHKAPVTFDYFDTEPQGKYVLGLVYWPGGAPAAGPPGKVSHLAPVVRDAQAVSAYWQRLGFPALDLEHATPREDSRYRGKPLLLSFDVGWQRFSQFTLEWIIPPSDPPNIYADFLKMHGEGIQHVGMPVADLAKTTEEYEKLGYSVWQAGAWGDVGKKDSGQYHYMDTDSIGGVTVELIHEYK